MSYCVNCGVELDATRAACPLCSTPVYNPNQPIDTVSPTPYPTAVGKTEKVDSRELTILMTIVFLTIGVVCGGLNLFVITRTHWSLYVIGVCAMGWVGMMPVFFHDRLSAFVYIALDGLAVAAYIGMISLLHPGMGWYPEVALPIILVSTLLIEIFYLFIIRRKTSMIGKAILIMTIVASISVAVEVLLGFHFERHIVLTWSAVVLLCCAAIVVILVTIALQQGLREELRKRLHF